MRRCTDNQDANVDQLILNPREIVDDLVNLCYARLSLNQVQRETLKHLRIAAKRFFSQPEELKARHVSRDFNFGYRPFGLQYSITAERPDLNESFAYWADANQTVPNHEHVQWFTLALHNYWKIVSQVGRLVLDEVAARFSCSGGLPFEDASYIETNWYSANAQRDLLQDKHEDGHLLTIVNSNGPGLEIELSNGSMLPINFEDCELIVMPGSLLSDMTGRWIEPLYHQVRNYRLLHRLTVLYMINPRFDRPITPFVLNNYNKGVDIAKRARTNGQGFGLSEAPILPYGA